MKYSSFPGTDICASRLGYGCMRLPVKNEEGNPIDHPEAIRLIRHAIDNGVTYVDTAWGYHGGESEVLVGEALADGYREKVTLTTKLPVWKVEKYEDMEALLDQQLGRLKQDHVDFYLAHAVGRESFDRVRDLGLFKFFEDMQRKGKIRYPGFSFHDDAEAFKHILDSYDWKMAQVQMNILDEFNQATMKGIEYAASKGIGIVIMEPLRGGALTRNVPESVKQLYGEMPVKRSPAAWAFRYLYDRPEIVTILSGMSEYSQVAENLEIFDEADANTCSEAEKQLFCRVREAYEARVRVGCTGCEYCQPCPQEIKIPKIFRGYDNACIFDQLERFYANYMTDRMAQNCIKCGACESACPQHIEIRSWLERIDDEAAQHA
ncbi:MAG: aldo/keto reductase [Clostridia bacterium]|nr:aldo/keto reductase [Clostridia bacterium]